MTSPSQRSESGHFSMWMTSRTRTRRPPSRKASRMPLPSPRQSSTRWTPTSTRTSSRSGLATTRSTQTWSRRCSRTSSARTRTTRAPRCSGRSRCTTTTTTRLTGKTFATS
ncbi:hypothetical protein MPH_01709 [Macrophomina phaseolina MS6]|uniref:Uncharacterized protein n=1 Tax=Macrophomina phaseolina (strain MS6) TaxID=1126212 RepID=K2SEX9_MACPH|nr:hypothetical protein MPH_01709 [Macrophomina phaseolina MS6]